MRIDNDGLVPLNASFKTAGLERFRKRVLPPMHGFLSDRILCQGVLFLHVQTAIAW
jgi:hypothetical protein